MLDCLIIGDSIAVGTATYRRDCSSIAKVGITSEQFNSRYRVIDPAKVTVISLGSNDGEARTTKMTLETLRVRLGGGNRTFIWIVPYGPAGQIVRDIAEKYGDGAIERPANKLEWDNIHPTAAGYQEIAKKFVVLPDKE
jgi:lysophospholipase L1-like esterase